MQRRSWMAALAIAATLATGRPAATAAGAGSRPDDPPVANTVHLNLQILGLGEKGGTVQVRPAHPACQFKEVSRTVPRAASGEVIKLPLMFDARSTSPDRDCTFAITIREPGRAPRTYRRGLRLAPQVAGQPAPVQILPCYLTAPTLAARMDAEKTKR